MGSNFPDIQLLLQNKPCRDIPVMIEAKGTKGKLEKLTKQVAAGQEEEKEE